MKESRIFLDHQVDDDALNDDEYTEEYLQCDHCDSNLVNIGDLKQHSEEKYSMDILQNFSNNPWC